MDAKELIKLRKEAEKAVSDMPEGELKVKAFEVILSRLLQPPQNIQARKEVITSEKSEAIERKGSTKGHNEQSSAGRILVLKEEKFFESQKSISEVKQELSAYGWHYPITTLSGVLQELVKKRELRRIKVKKSGNKVGVWKYSNP